MVETSINKFSANLESFVDKAVNEHMLLKITRQAGKAFVVLSAEDWEREQETLYVLQNSSLIKQIAESNVTHQNKKGYIPSEEELDESYSV